MRILYTNFHEGYGGGHDTYILTLIKALSDKHVVTLAAPEASRLYQKLSSEIPSFAINYKRTWTSSYRKLIRFKQWIDEQQLDLIHVNGPSDHIVLMALCPWLKRKPKIVFTKHNSSPLKGGKRFRLRYFTDAVIAVSKQIHQQLPSACLRHKLVKTIHNGVNTDFYRPVTPEEKSKLRAKYRLAANDFIFTSVAGTAAHKGWITLVEAVASLPDELKAHCKIIMAGTPPAPVLIEQINQLGMTQQVLFPGLLEDVREIIAVGDVGFVLPALEALSFACREMMAMGLPVIASNTGGLPENITVHQDGWPYLYPHCNHSA